jgi:succinate-acetate transporter protein
VANDIEARLEALKREVEGLKGKAVTVTETIANPAPLGLAGFGLTTLLLNVVNAKIVSGDGLGMVLPVGLFYGGLAQLLAGQWEFKKNNTFGATAFTSFGAFWLAFAVMELLAKNNLLGPAGQAGSWVPGPAALTVFLVGWGIFTTYMFVGTMRISVALMVVFAALAILFYLLAWGEHNANVHKFAGYEGLFTAGAALYTSFAQIVNETWGQYLMPLGIIKRTVPDVQLGLDRK